MKAIFSSATKVVLLLFSLTICVGFLLKRIDAVLFIQTGTLVLGAYFTNKGSSSKEVNDPIIPTV